MKEITVNSFTELTKVVFDDCYDEKLGRYRNNIVYRGLPDASFHPISKLNRVCSHDLSLEEPIMRSFVRYGKADLDADNSFWQNLATGQHYGLPTRLMDWTFSPLVAAHFVTEDIDYYDKDGVIYAIRVEESFKRMPEVLKKELDSRRTVSLGVSSLMKYARNFEELKNLKEDPFFIFFEPTSTTDRMANQYALFSMCSDAAYNLEDLLDEDSSLVKIVIPKEIKLEIRDKLDYLNISERMIYPGLDGICSWITRHYADLSQYALNRADDKDL